MLILRASKLGALVKYTSRLEENKLVSYRMNLICTSNNYCCKYNCVGRLKFFGQIKQLTSIIQILTWLFSISWFALCLHLRLSPLRASSSADSLSPLSSASLSFCCRGSTDLTASSNLAFAASISFSRLSLFCLRTRLDSFKAGMASTFSRSRAYFDDGKITELAFSVARARADLEQKVALVLPE